MGAGGPDLARVFGNTVAMTRATRPMRSIGARSARSQHLFVRENEWDASQSVWLWCDQSASMAYRSDLAPCLKRDRALILGLALASLLTRGGERVASLGQDGIPSSGRAGLNRLSNYWLGMPEQDNDRSGLPPLQDLPRYATVILIGTFLTRPTRCRNVFVNLRHLA